MYQDKYELPQSFKEPEYRDGFLISSDRKKIWAVQLDLLHELLRVCENNNIRLCLYAGSLLGAIRHKGFIPWDDDIDVCMTRIEFNKLIKVVNNFKAPYFLQTAYNDKKFFFGYARLRNSNTTAIIKGNESIEYNNGIYIDIFVFDGYVDSKLLYNYQMLSRFIIQELLINFYRENFEDISIIKRIFLKCVQCVEKKVLDYRKLINRYHLIISKYKSCDKVTFLTHPEYLLTRYWCYKSELNDLMYIQFENLYVPIPRDYDIILKRIYGNYLKLPPEDERGKWHEGMIEFNPDIPYTEFLKN